jgi:hypothetical protein
VSSKEKEVISWGFKSVRMLSSDDERRYRTHFGAFYGGARAGEARDGLELEGLHCGHIELII